MLENVWCVLTLELFFMTDIKYSFSVKDMYESWHLFPIPVTSILSCYLKSMFWNQTKEERKYVTNSMLSRPEGLFVVFRKSRIWCELWVSLTGTWQESSLCDSVDGRSHSEKGLTVGGLVWLSSCFCYFLAVWPCASYLTSPDSVSSTLKWR